MNAKLHISYRAQVTVLSLTISEQIQNMRISQRAQVTVPQLAISKEGGGYTDRMDCLVASAGGFGADLGGI